MFPTKLRDISSLNILNLLGGLFQIFLNRAVAYCLATFRGGFLGKIKNIKRLWQIVKYFQL